MADLATVDRTSEVTHFAASAQWTGIMSDDREKWLAVRRDYLTASDMAAVLGQDTWKTAFQVWVDKVTERKEKSDADFYSPMFWGTALEWPIAQIAAQQFKWGLRRGGALLRSRRHPRLAATLDAEILVDGAWLDYEGKTTSFFMRRDWDEDEQSPPRRVLIQCQHQLLVTGAPAAVIFCLIGGNKPVKIVVEPNERFHQHLVERSEWFFDLIERGCPPPVTAQDTAALERFFPAANDGSVVRLPVEAREWTERILAIAEEQKRLKAEEDQLRNQVRQCIGSGTFGVLDEPVDGRRYWRWQEQQREAYSVPAGTSRVLSRLKNGPAVDHVWDQLPVGKLTTLEELLDRSVANIEQTAPLQSDECLRINEALFGTVDQVFEKPKRARKR